MASWYLCKIRFQKEDEAGALKTINEAFLFDAVSYTETEAAAYAQIVTGASDFSITSITRYRLADLFSYEDGEQWFKAKLIYFSVDEKSGKEKKIVNYMLVNAEGIQQALDRINEGMRNFLIPFEIVEVALTIISDVFPYTGEKNDELEVPENMLTLSEAIAERRQ
ncbi:MAG: DUF4494 domain-containing protein [Dyadobacter sp.]|uniref:DUF4494 domain-containing protein n=1 Tax=Dyadobacter sp. TaxID=1914288 RepID=UPI001AFEA30C|nr:DUF4494 domain-containing protein [Dyadobacter sp.]MBO9615608.1 DUF4494 domain-containing protein [Dyadobacter sp.]